MGKLESAFGPKKNRMSYKNVLYDLNTVTLLNKNFNIHDILSSGRDT
jgi:hypothetical protein